MKKVTLSISNSQENRTVTLEDEMTVGRTAPSGLVLQDVGLSRKNTTFFRDGEDVLVVDENSTNGTFLNGAKIAGRPQVLKDGDSLKIGSETIIRVEFEGAKQTAQKTETTDYQVPPKTVNTTESGVYDIRAGKVQNPKSKIQNPDSADSSFSTNKLLLVGSAAFTLLFIVLGAVVFFVVRTHDNGGLIAGDKPIQQISAQAVIPVRVIDPLGGEDENDLDDLMSSWEVEEKELNASDIEEIKTTEEKGTSDLKVPIEFWQKQRDLALNHAGAAGAERAGLITLPQELFGGGVPKQKAKLAELIREGKYKQPMDFADLAQLRLDHILVEMPMATNSFVLDVGGSAGEGEFTSFDWDAGVQPIATGSDKYKTLQRLANDFDGQKYDLNNPKDRKQMRMRLLRMYNANSRKVFEELCNAYYQKFHVPLRVTSLTRSMDYQISLNKTNANSFKVSGKGSLPPHTSGCAFDMSRKNLSAEEQNFMMILLSTWERDHKLDSLREGSDNACFHTFIYPDGKEAQ